MEGKEKQGLNGHGLSFENVPNRVNRAYSSFAAVMGKVAALVRCAWVGWARPELVPSRTEIWSHGNTLLSYTNIKWIENLPVAIMRISFVAPLGPVN